MPRQRTFFMPPAHTPAPIEQKDGVDVYTVLRDHLKYVELIHNELHRQRRSNQELTMKVSELSSKVDNLISVATDIKSRADAAGSNSGGAPVFTPPAQEDDPEVQRLADRIDEAVRILKGEQGSSQGGETPQSPVITEPPANAFPDPNSPVPSEPSPEVPAVDPNAPV